MSEPETNGRSAVGRHLPTRLSPRRSPTRRPRHWPAAARQVDGHRNTGDCRRRSTTVHRERRRTCNISVLLLCVRHVREST